jgi:uncharacterized repeat protein (TIGR03803 family)
MWMWDGFSRLRLDRKFLAVAVATLIVVMSLTFAPAARARNDVPDAMPTVTETVLYSFGVGPTAKTCQKIDDGADPLGSLTYVSATGLLFGRTSSTTSQGNQDGTIFQINPDGSGYVVDHFFTGPKTDGAVPRHSSMTLLGNVLYGTTLMGGKKNNGTIFSINDDGTDYSTPLFNFPASAKNNYGDQPHSCFVAIGSVLYGMTSEGGKKGGTTGFGTIFSYDTSADTYIRLHSFDGKHGSDPHGQLILDPDGVTFYGMTRTGGKHQVGVIFSYDSAKSKYKVLHDFSCPGNSTPMCTDSGDGATPDHGTLVQLNSTLFGLTTYGGKYGNGTLFSIHTDGKHFTILQQFGASGSNDGANPYGSLLLDGTTLYGTTRNGGNKGNGSVFQINTDGSDYDRIYDFQNGNDAANPIDNVILLDNTLYGMAEAGGLCGDGAIFALDLTSLDP